MKDYNIVDWESIVYYDETSPTFLRWKISKGGKTAGKRKEGAPAGTVLKTGYVFIRFNKELYLGHRVVWILGNGKIPEGLFIDHIDGNPFNNGTENLRLSTYADNMRNRRRAKNNTSGVTGVYYNQKQDAFSAVWYELDGTCRSKQFGCNKYGKDVAFKLAADHREGMLHLLNEQGAGYTDRHMDK